MMCCSCGDHILLKGHITLDTHGPIKQQESPALPDRKPSDPGQHPKNSSRPTTQRRYVSQSSVTTFPVAPRSQLLVCRPLLALQPCAQRFTFHPVFSSRCWSIVFVAFTSHNLHPCSILRMICLQVVLPHDIPPNL